MLIFLIRETNISLAWKLKSAPSHPIDQAATALKKLDSGKHVISNTKYNDETYVTSDFPHVEGQETTSSNPHKPTGKNDGSFACVATQLLELFLCDLQGLNLCHRFDGSRTRLIAKQGVFTKVIALLQSGHFLPEAKPIWGKLTESEMVI